ncbi:MAG: CDP-alcohol phosphatidyltransferase family protein [Planctomycetaceae bacterium]
MSTETDADYESAPFRRKTRRQKVFAVLPTMLTLGNAVCGFGAISIAAKVGPDSFGGNELIVASQLIFLAMLFDALDGSAARLTNQTTDFGAQLDSLCDVVSFGAAPAFIMLQLTHPAHHLMNTVENAPFEYHPRVLFAIAALFLVCATLRLARFNVETDEDDSHDAFSGLPSPAAAGVIVSFPIGLRGLKDLVTESTASWVAPVLQIVRPSLVVLLPLIALATAMLMVSRIPYPHVFNQFVRGQRGRKQMIQMVFAIALVFVVREMALPVLFCAFAFAAPLQKAWQKSLKPAIHGKGTAVGG